MNHAMIAMTAMYLAGCGIIGDIPVIGSACNSTVGSISDVFNVLKAIGDVFADFIEFFVNPTGAILYMFFGIKSTPSTSPLAILFPVIGCHIDGACSGNIFNAGPSALAGKLSQSMQVLAVSIASVCAAARALKLVVTKEGPGWVSVVLVDVLGRLCVVIGLIYVGYDVLIVLYNASADLGAAVMYGFFNAGTNSSLPGALTQLFNQVLGGWLMTLLADLMSIYVFAVLIAARILFLFGATLCPLIIAVTAYSEKTQVVTWYARLMVGTVLTPFVAGASIGVVGAFAAAADSNLPVIGNFMVAMIFIAGFWFVGKCLRELCTSAFDLAAFGVAVATSVVAIAATVGAAVATGGVSLAGAGAGGGMPLIGDGANPMDPTGGGAGGGTGRELAPFSGVQMPSGGNGQPHMPGATPEFEDFMRSMGGSGGGGGGARAAAMGSSAEEFSETQTVTQSGGGGASGGGGGGFVGGLGGAALRALSQSNPLSHIDQAFWGHQHGASHVVNQAAGTAGYGGGYGSGGAMGGGAMGGGGGGVVQGGQTTVEHTVTARRKVDWAAFMATNPEDFSNPS